LPLFAPLFDSDTHITFWSGHLSGQMTTRDMIYRYLSWPWFPVSPDNSDDRLGFRDFHSGDVLSPRDGITIRTLGLRHPDGCIGYRVEWAGRAVALVYDYEPEGETPDPDVLNFMKNADLAVYDSTYTDEELPKRCGYGHSTWQHGVKLAKAANVGRMALFHHDPSRTDDELDTIEKHAKKQFAGAVAVHDNQIIDI
jgi:phosphoribosyl 1,2-cyclic phosphodiesterase